MAVDFCDVADALRCNPSPDDELFKNLVLHALIALIEGGSASAGAGVVLAQKAIAFGSIGAAYTDTTLLDSTKKLKRIYIQNQSDANVEISLDGGATTAFTVLANSDASRDLGDFTAAATTSVRMRYQAATVPTIGTVYIDGSY